MSLEVATGDYEVDRQRHVRARAAQLPGEVEKMTWPLERLHALRDERLRALIRAALQRSPWHARRLRHIDVDKLCGGDLTTIPPMTKDDLMAHWDEIVTDRRLSLSMANAHLTRTLEQGPAYLLDAYHVVTSGGTTGRRGVFAWDFEGWLAYGLIAQRGDMWLVRRGGGTGQRRGATIMASHPTHVSASASRTFAEENQAPSIILPVSRPVSELVSALNAFEPTHIVTYPSVLHQLTLEAQAGRLRIHPDMLICSGEPLLPEIRSAAELTFQAPLINYYGTSEFGLIARSYPGLPGMYLMEDTAVYELVDIHGRPVRPGERAAKLFVTNVVNSLLPLIRYELTDEVVFMTEPNPGPWTSRRIADVQGRMDDLFVYLGGVVVHPHVFRSALSRVPEVIEYQVSQTQRGAEIVVRGGGAFDVDAIRQELHTALARLGLSDPLVSIVPAPALDRLQGSGKLKRFFPLAKNDGASDRASS